MVQQCYQNGKKKLETGKKMQQKRFVIGRESVTRVT